MSKVIKMSKTSKMLTKTFQKNLIPLKMSKKKIKKVKLKKNEEEKR